MKIYCAHRIHEGAFRNAPPEFCNAPPRRWLQEWPKHVASSLYFFFLWRFDLNPDYDLLQGFAITLIGHTILGRTPLEKCSA